MSKVVDEHGRPVVDGEALADAMRRGGRPTSDDVTIMLDGRRIDTAAKLRSVIDEFTRVQAVQQRRTGPDGGER